MSWDNLQETTSTITVQSKIANKGKVLLFCYAFPPMQVQMTAAVFKPMAALTQLGFTVDVVCADSFSPHLPLDESLLPYAGKIFSRVTRLNPPGGFRGVLQERIKVLSRVPDLMTVLHESAFKCLMDMDLSAYDAVMTWSPFHSINPVMVRIKKHRKDVRWIAQFSDPWAGNPLEVSKLAMMWNNWHEPKTVKAADFIIHSSRYSLDLMLKNHSSEVRARTEVLPHVYNLDLYPNRSKQKNAKITMRYAGVLYGRRSPEPLFKALNQLLKQRPELADEIVVELVGLVPDEMLNSEAARSLPGGMVSALPNVNYIESLRLMYDADILLLIEADIRQNLFLPSKLSDYIGANTPIVGLVPPGGSEDALVGLGAWYALPSDIAGITKALAGAIDHVLNGCATEWCNKEFKETFSGLQVAGQLSRIIESIK